MRAIAALGVLVFHVWLYRPERPRGRRPELLDQVLFHGNAGLICFFVLSGFLLYSAFAAAALTPGGQGVALGQYVRRRAARIVPAYWVCGAGCLALYRFVGYDAITPSTQELVLHALFLQNYSLATVGDLNPVTWTLGVEVAFYALLALVGWVALRLGPRRIRAQVALVVALILVTPAWNALVLARGWDAVAEKALPAYLGSFGLGMLVALWVQWGKATGRPRRLGPRATAAVIAAAAIVVVGDAVLHENGWWLREGIFAEGLLRPRMQSELVGHLGAAAGFALLIAAAACGSGAAVAWLGWRPLAALGVISYGLYLWHLPLLLVMREAGLLPDAIGPRVLVVLAASVVVAAASWRWVERPWVQRRGSARAERRELPGGAGAPAQSVG